MEGYLARDKNGSLYFYFYEPRKSDTIWDFDKGDHPVHISEFDETEETRKISWEDKYATLVKVNFKIIRY